MAVRRQPYNFAQPSYTPLPRHESGRADTTQYSSAIPDCFLWCRPDRVRPAQSETGLLDLSKGVQKIDPSRWYASIRLLQEADPGYERPPQTRDTLPFPYALRRFLSGSA